MALIAVLTAFAVIAPDGWQPDPTLSEISGAEGYVTRAFRAPDGESVLVAGKLEDDVTISADALERAPGEFADDVVRDGGKVVFRTRRIDHGRTIDEIGADLSDGSSVRARWVRGMHRGRLQSVYGQCYGRPPPMEACVRHLGLLNVEIEPEVDYGPLRRSLALIAGALVIAVAGGVLVRRRRRTARLKRSAPLVDGEIVKLGGRVRALGPSIESPLSGTTCVAYVARGLRVNTQGDVLDAPVERRTTPFVVETGHGPITISGDDLELACRPAKIATDGNPRLRAFASRHGFTADGSEHYDEITIVAGANVSICGVVSVRRDAASTIERGYRDDAPTATYLIAAPPTPLQILDVWDAPPTVRSGRPPPFA